MCTVTSNLELGPGTLQCVSKPRFENARFAKAKRKNRQKKGNRPGNTFCSKNAKTLKREARCQSVALLGMSLYNLFIQMTPNRQHFQKRVRLEFWNSFGAKSVAWVLPNVWGVFFCTWP